MNMQLTTYKKQNASCLAGRLFFICTCLFLLGLSQHAVAQPGNSNPGYTPPEGYAAIGDYVWVDANNNGLQDKDEPGVARILVVLYDGVLNVIASKYTDASGHYQFDSIVVPPSGDKSFIVGFYNVPPDYNYTQQAPDNISSNVNSKLDPITGRTKPFMLHSGQMRTDIDAGIKNAPGVVLPLTVDQFQGNYSNGFIQLMWTAFAELNIDHFDIERCTDGTNFRKIGTVSSEDYTGNSISFSYHDVSAEKGSNFYRLVMVDKDGNYTYSKAITVSVDVKGISVSVVYPNPFSKRVQVKIDCNIPEQITIRVIDNAGTVIRTQLANVVRGENNIVIQNVSELPGGVYYLEVIADHRTMKTKLMKQ